MNSMLELIMRFNADLDRKILDEYGNNFLDISNYYLSLKKSFISYRTQRIS